PVTFVTFYSARQRYWCCVGLPRSGFLFIALCVSTGTRIFKSNEGVLFIPHGTVNSKRRSGN
ncbi:hypothetical protein, partial [Dysgonomonas sp. 521]|uniref:hypothetical protein n=1 Tax=Dysgonomonas sp. 521 TaxID=2302932 RepID=UPI001C8882D5